MHLTLRKIRWQRQRHLYKSCGSRDISASAVVPHGRRTQRRRYSLHANWSHEIFLAGLPRWQVDRGGVLEKGLGGNQSHSWLTSQDTGSDVAILTYIRILVSDHKHIHKQEIPFTYFFVSLAVRCVSHNHSPSLLPVEIRAPSISDRCWAQYACKHATFGLILN